MPCANIGHLCIFVSNTNSNPAQLFQIPLLLSYVQNSTLSKNLSIPNGMAPVKKFTTIEVFSYNDDLIEILKSLHKFDNVGIGDLIQNFNFTQNLLSLIFFPQSISFILQ